MDVVQKAKPQGGGSGCGCLILLACAAVALGMCNGPKHTSPPARPARPASTPQPTPQPNALHELPRAELPPYREPAAGRYPRDFSTFGQLPNGAAYLAAAPGPLVYAAEWHGTSVRSVAAHNQQVALAPRFGQIVGLACDPKGTLYVADAQQNCVWAVKGGRATPFMGGRAPVPEGFKRPQLFAKLAGVGADARGNVYALDLNDHAIVRRTPAGELEYVGISGGWVKPISFFGTRMAVAPTGTCYLWGYLNRNWAICRTAGDELGTLEMPDEHRAKEVLLAAGDAEGHVFMVKRDGGLVFLEREGKTQKLLDGTEGVTALATELPRTLFAARGGARHEITRLDF